MPCTQDIPLTLLFTINSSQWYAEQFRGKVSSTPSFIVTGKVLFKGHSSDTVGKGRLKVTLQKKSLNTTKLFKLRYSNQLEGPCKGSRSGLARQYY